MKTVLLSSAYLAPIEYYTKLYTADRILVERYDHYIKQTYRNRCVIVGANGTLSLTIPTEKEEFPKVLMKDVRISDHGNWRHVHWNALESAYRNSPFFEYYADDFRGFYEKKYSYLWDFNEALCDVVCSLIDLHPNKIGTTDYQIELENEIDDFRDVIHPKKNYKEVDPSFHPLPYYQVFKEKFGFIPNLSIVDLLFNMGPESLLVLRDSQR